jgi:hypothetical protein
VIDHLKRVFSNPRDAELVRWHSEKRRKNNEEIRHPTDGTQWKFFDLQYKPFGSESRNIRFALSTDGINPFGENRTVHITWPVILVMYNLSTWLCHKRKYLYCLFLSKVRSKLAPILMCSWNHSWKIWQNSRMKGCVCGTSISRSISHCMQSYSFASMMLLGLYIIRTD